MAGGVGGERRNNGGGSGRLKRRRPAEPRELDMLFSRYVLLRTYLLKAVTGFGYLALTWSTVVLLGGFVTSLQKQDFWCITVISMMQAARIFSDLAEQLLPNFFNLVTRLIRHNRDVLRYEMWRAASSTFAKVSILLYGGILMLFLAICYIPSLLYKHGGAIACIALAMWRIAQRDYGADPHDNSKANLTPALDMFYSLILLQGVFYLAWLHVDSSSVDHLVSLRCLCRLPSTEWCRLALVEYLVDTRARCWRDLSSIRGRRLVDHAVDLLDSRSWEDNLSGVRLLDAFIRQGTADVRSLLLSSRPKVQKLIDTLGCRHGPQAGGSREIRELAGHVLAHLAGDIHLAQFPGAIQCISSLLQDETTTTTACYWDGSQQQERPRSQQTKLASQRQAILLRLEKREQRHEKREQLGPGLFQQLGGASDDNIAGGCHGNELILQGLAILESLASDHHNCRYICATPGLVPKIMAPICSDTLIEDFGSSGEWASVVNGSFRVLHRLISATGETSRTLRLKIASNNQAVRNLEMVLDQRNVANQELKIQAMKILTELALDSSIKIPDETKEKFIEKQLQIFLAGEGEQEPTSLTNPLKVTAGRTLVLISTNSQTNSDIIMRPDHGNVLARITGLLDTKKNIIYRTIAAEILENLCTHCDWNKHDVIESLLPKVFTEILSIKSDRPKIKTSDEKENKPQARRWTLFKKKHDRGNEENLKNSAPGKDEENPQNIALRTKEQSQRCPPGDRNMIQEISSSGDEKKSSDPQNEEQTTSTKELLEALLSLALAICGKLIKAGDAVQVDDLGGDAFVVKLKTIIDDNCKPTGDSLRIVKLCGWIAASMMQCQAYAELFRNKEFVQSLSKASKIMSSLESCMMFTGTDFRLKKTIRPLLSNIVSELEQKTLQSV